MKKKYILVFIFSLIINNMLFSNQEISPMEMNRHIAITQTIESIGTGTSDSPDTESTGTATSDSSATESTGTGTSDSSDTESTGTGTSDSSDTESIGSGSSDSEGVDINSLEGVELRQMDVYIGVQDQVSVTMIDSNMLFKLDFAYKGINGLYTFDNFYYDYMNGSGDQILVSSDWIGPYIMKNLGVENQDGEYFTGGFHGTNGDTTGNPTAECIGLDFVVDGKLIDDTYAGSCEVLDVFATNLIQGNNSNEAVLEEFVHYRIINGEVKVKVVGTALKSLEIQRYYGLQTQNKLWGGETTYFYENETTLNTSTMAFSETDKETIARKFQMTSNDGLRTLTVRLYKNGLGLFNQCSDDYGSVFTQDYGKSYFNLVRGKSLLLEEGESFNWSGSYEFFE